ncbi:uncharacterized protein EI97DRAFT_49647 [Westerdykella ornata]|uniref:C2H2-type domain-containing protein n=1 Tax=Westerdykella ornata TaxID=318751 RepID=A0A6A6JI93_WESOR|nr:uncharacterized protein EI97DRAFT_49647 [Westerdykella ornata]KAF2276117.1 hypothetical protein EI97DRAFT_49647 [Westerdykella ornata]
MVEALRRAGAPPMIRAASGREIHIVNSPEPEPSCLPSPPELSRTSSVASSNPARTPPDVRYDQLLSPKDRTVTLAPIIANHSPAVSYQQLPWPTHPPDSRLYRTNSFGSTSSEDNPYALSGRYEYPPTLSQHWATRAPPPAALDSRAQRVEGERKQYPCPEAVKFKCNELFTTSGHASRHWKSVHLKKKDAKCPHCSKMFGRVDNMKQHMRTHENEGHRRSSSRATRPSADTRAATSSSKKRRSTALQIDTEGAAPSFLPSPSSLRSTSSLPSTPPTPMDHSFGAGSGMISPLALQPPEQQQCGTHFLMRPELRRGVPYGLEPAVAPRIPLPVY